MTIEYGRSARCKVYNQRMRAIAATAFLSLLITQSVAQSAADVDRAVREHLQRTQTAGCAIAIVRGGNITFAKGYGLANLETDSPATEETIFRIGSITKPFIATLIMLNVEQGKIRLDDPVSKYLKDLPEPYRPVTIRQLLSHTSGIPNYTDLPAFSQRVREKGTAKAMIEMAASAKPDFAPGEGWRYSNTGYILLGEVLTQVEGRPWQEALSKRIIEPLGMKSTAVIDLSRVVPRRAEGYQPKGSGYLHADYLDMGWPGSAGALESTVLDLVKFENALGTKLLKPESYALMVTAAKSKDGKTHGYGLGWGLSKLQGTPIVFHGGGIFGFTSALVKVPSKNLTAVVLTNNEVPQAEVLALKLIGLAEPSLAKPEKPVEDKTPELTAFLKSKFESLIAGTLAPGDLTPDFAKVMTPQLVKDVASTLGTAGPVTGFQLVEAKENPDGSTRVYLVQFGPNSITATFTVTKERKIAGLTLKG